MSAPSCEVRRPRPAVYPAITQDWLRQDLIFTQSGVRNPGRYCESARLPTIPSTPERRATSNSAMPSRSTCSAKRMYGESTMVSRSVFLRMRSSVESRSRPSSCSRSKAMNVTGCSAAMRRASLSRPTLMRCCNRSNDGRPSVSRTTSSPSITACRARIPALIECASGYREVSSPPRRPVMRTASPSTLTIARIPSYFSSKIHPSRENGFSIEVASIGAGARAGPTAAGALTGTTASPRARARRISRGSPPPSLAISAKLLPVLTETSRSIASNPGTTNESRFLSISQFLVPSLLPPYWRPRSPMWTSANSPEIFVPVSWNFTSPRTLDRSTSSADSLIHSKVPMSQSITVPAPYPEGITPSNSP